MLRKIIISCLVSIAISTESFASEPVAVKAAPVSHKAEAYVGVSAGLPVKYDHQYSANAFAGYGKKLGPHQRFYVGGELTGSINTAPSRAHYQSGYTDFSLGASFIPGVMLTPTLMAYGRIGEKLTYYHGNTGYIATQLGAGLQKDINKNWGVRGEYVAASDNTRQATLGLVYKFD